MINFELVLLSDYSSILLGSALLASSWVVLIHHLEERSDDCLCSSLWTRTTFIDLLSQVYVANLLSAIYLDTKV